jgi:hypothetical protein
MPEFIRMLVGYLLISGVSEEDIRIMICENPAKLLGLHPHATNPEN